MDTAPTMRLTGYMPDGTEVERDFRADEWPQIRTLIFQMAVVNITSLVVISMPTKSTR